MNDYYLQAIAQHLHSITQVLSDIKAELSEMNALTEAEQDRKHE